MYVFLYIVCINMIHICIDISHDTLSYYIIYNLILKPTSYTTGKFETSYVYREEENYFEI